MATATITPQCKGTVSAHGRSWRCTQRAAKKHAYEFCGRCAPQPVYCGRGGPYLYHQPDCVGCPNPCCKDHALCTETCYMGLTREQRRDWAVPVRCVSGNHGTN